eukprot:4457406-Alexandrium_andersonii.AAC.1
MSASLVGSEMCIRDRGTRHRAPGTGHALALRAGRKRGRVPVRVRVRVRAVSYTHLTLPTICSV